MLLLTTNRKDIESPIAPYDLSFTELERLSSLTQIVSVLIII